MGAFPELLRALLLVEALVGSLCLAILAVRRVLCRWPDVPLRLDGTEPRNVAGGQSLLAAVRGEGYLLPGSCGGRGTCGVCRMHVRRGGGERAPAEEVLISPADLRAGLRLACQVRVRQEIEAELPEDARAAAFVRAVVSSREDLTHAVHRLLVRIEEPPGWKFAAGQYVQMFQRQPEEGGEPLTRAYSIASDPAAAEIIEFHIQHVPGGEMTPWLCSRSPGDELWFSGPYGGMTLGEGDAGRQVVCVAGGVGFAPMKSVILSLAGRSAPPTTWLFAGAASRTGLYEHDWAVAMAARNPWLVYVPCVQGCSDEPADDSGGEGREFERGLVTEALERRFPAGTPAVALLCGPERMVAAARSVLAGKGLDPKDIRADTL
ncbi:MAG TPA: 2Fe-2S iron-sulfur cluster binding domain-containing protein [Candidatus Ozemobacteraceae bacterium]|nr:2Fe-2S iron-sulfur cluster binding domain-containing protein [Candidatus Ozemobacteraceae bacterium]